MAVRNFLQPLLEKRAEDPVKKRRASFLQPLVTGNITAPQPSSKSADWILNPEEYQPFGQLSEDALRERVKTQKDMRQFQTSARGITREQFASVVDEWKQRQIEYGNMDDLISSAQRRADYGMAQSPEQALTSELADQAAVRLLDLPHDLAHKLSDRFTGFDRGKLSDIQGLAKDNEQPPSEPPERAGGGFLDELIGGSDIKQKVAEAALAQTFKEFGATAKVTPSMPTILPARAQPEQGGGFMDFLKKMYVDPTIKQLERIPSERRQLKPMEEQYTAGIGELVSATAGVAGWAKARKTENLLNAISKELLSKGEAVDLGDITFESLKSPEFWKKVPLFAARMTPFMQALIPAMVGGYVTGGTVAGIVGLGALGQGILGALGATALQRPLEGLLEAGGTRQEAIQRGFSEPEADKAAVSVFLNNLKLSGMDVGELATAFLPTPAKLGAKFLKPFVAGGRVVATAGQEGVEEVFQQKWRTEALGDKFSLTSPETKQAAFGGALMGGAMGGAGGVFNMIKTRATDTLTPTMSQRFDKLKTSAMKRGMNDERAGLFALNEIAKTPEGKRIVEQATKWVEGQQGEVSPPSVQAVQAGRAELTPEKPFKSDNPRLEGVAIFDLVTGKILEPKDIIRVARNSQARSDVMIGGEGHDLLAEGKAILAGEFKGTQLGENPRIRFDKDKNLFDVRYDSDRFLRDEKNISEEEYRDGLGEVTRALKVKYPGIGISIPETGEFIPPQAGRAELKQPWEMTKQEVYDKAKELLTPGAEGRPFLAERTELLNKQVNYHKTLVQQALSEGKPVPPEVLKDYPELTPPAGVTPEVTPTAPETGVTAPPPVSEGIPPIEAPPVAVAPPPRKPPKDWDKVKTDLWDRYNKFSPEATPTSRPLSETLKGLSRGIEKLTADEFARLNKLGWNSEIDSAMVKASSGKAAEVYRKTMTNVHKEIKGDNNLLRFVDDYLIFRHQLEVMRATGRKTVTMSKGGEASEFTYRQIQLLIAQMKDVLGKDVYEQVKQASSHVPETYHNILRESSEITPDVAEGLISKYPWYNPILYETEGAEAIINIGKKLTPSQVKKLTEFDIDRQVESPLSVLASTVKRRVTANAKNEARKSIANDAVKSTEWGGLVEIVDKKPTGAFIDFFENGERRYLQLGKGTEWIAEDIALFETQPKNVISRVAKALNNIPRAAFTTYNPAFIVTNTLFDSLAAYFKEGIYPWQTARALGNNIKDLFTEDPLMNQFRTAGGDVGGFFRGEKDMTEEFIRVGKEGNIVIRNPRDLKKYINPFQIVKALGHAGENAPRLATYTKAIKEGATPKEAGLRARRVSVDFARMGTASKFLNDYFLFFNAGTQGFLLPGRALRDDPRSWWRLALLMSAVVGTIAYNLTYDEYKDVPDSIKYGSVHIMLPSTEYNKYGQKVPKYLTIVPNTREFALFFGPLVYSMQKLTEETPEASEGFFSDIRQAFDYWYPRWSPLSMITQTGGVEAPTQILQSINEISDNHDSFRNRPIVSDELLALPPKEQYDEYTSEMAIKVGQALNVSPKKLDFFVNSMTGTIGRDILQVVNNAIEQVDGEIADPRIVKLVDELRSIPTKVTPEKITLARKEFLDQLDEADRDLVLSMESLPKDRIPVITSIIQRIYREGGGQVYQSGKATALEQDRELPETSEEFLKEEAVQNAQNLIDGSITKYDYDNQRTRYRSVASGKSSAEWRQAMLEGAVSRADIDPFLAEGYGRAEEFRALSSYHEINAKQIDNAGGVFDSDTWDRIEELTLSEMRKQYPETSVQYALEHKDDWILELPEPARTTELERAAGIEDESWWDDYRGTSQPPKARTPYEPYKAPGTSGRDRLRELMGDTTTQPQYQPKEKTGREKLRELLGVR